MIFKTMTYWLARIATLLVIVVVMLYGYAQFVGVSPLEYPSVPFEVVGEEVKAGHAIPLIVFRCNNTQHSLMARLTRRLLNIDTGEVTQLPPTMVDVTPGCHRIPYTVDTVPAGEQVGTYILFGEARVEELFHSHIIQWQSEKFNVVE